MHDSDSLKDYPQVRQLAIRSLFEIIEQSSEGTVIVDRQARIVWMNERYARRFGLADAASAIGQPCETVIPGSLMRDVVSNGRPILLDMLDTPNEPLVVMRLPIHDDQGALIGAIGFALFDELRSLSPLLKRYASMQQELASTRSQLRARQAKYSFAQFVGSSAPSLEAKRRARRGAGSDSPVLLLGETGTGKEVVARALHQASPRADKPFVAVNCAAIPEGLIESELFGYREGAFTGSRRGGMVGRLMQAHGGTLFLDEIGDMPLALQARLLRVLQERRVAPLGAGDEQDIDVALICATHRDLKRLVQEQHFREDLFYRVNGVSLRLPALRERDDLAAIIQGLLDKADARGVTLDPALTALLEGFDWPGNIRQLEMVVRTALAMREDGEQVLTLDHLTDCLLDELASSAAPSGSLKDSELEQIRGALARHQGNVSAAAAALGISRATLYRKLKQLRG